MRAVQQQLRKVATLLVVTGQLKPADISACADQFHPASKGAVEGWLFPNILAQAYAKYWGSHPSNIPEAGQPHK